MALSQPELDELEQKEARSQKIIDKLFLVVYAYVAWTAGWAWVGHNYIDPLDSLVYVEVIAVFVLLITGAIVALNKVVNYIDEVRQLKIDIIYLNARLSDRQKHALRVKLEAYR